MDPSLARKRQSSLDASRPKETRRIFGIKTIFTSVAVCSANRCLAFCDPFLSEQQPVDVVSGDGQIYGDIHGKKLTIATTSRVAGAVDSILWNEMEFIDSHDHGRQMQSAASFDCSRDDPFWPERFNPTEAGSRADGVGLQSSSQLLSFVAKGNRLHTKTRMAFWLPPGEQSFGRTGLNSVPISNHLLEKRVLIGCSASDNAIQVDTEFQMPSDEKHRLAQFEVLTGYMPSSFQRFWKWDIAKRLFDSLDDGPGEQACPIAFSNIPETHALGVWMSDLQSARYSRTGYGRFRFVEENVVKWNCVVRIRDPNQIEMLRHAFRVYLAIGSLEEVTATFRQLADSGAVGVSS